MPETYRSLVTDPALGGQAKFEKWLKKFEHDFFYSEGMSMFRTLFQSLSEEEKAKIEAADPGMYKKLEGMLNGNSNVQT